MSSTRLIPINVRLPENLIKESDRLAELEGSSRTELVRTALRSYIERSQKLQSVFSSAEQRGKMAGINSQQDLERVLNEVRSESQAAK